MTDIEFVDQLKQEIHKINILLHQAAERELDVSIDCVKNQIMGRLDQPLLIIKVSKEL